MKELREMLSNTVSDTNRHNLRNSSDFVIPFSRLFSFQTSFFPSTLKLWNELNNEVRSSHSLRTLKTGLGEQPIKVPGFLLLGDRNTNIQLTRLRHRCSNLNADLYNVNIIPNSACRCGAHFETAEHFFF